MPSHISNGGTWHNQRSNLFHPEKELSYILQNHTHLLFRRRRRRREKLDWREMSSVAARALTGCRSLLAPASRTTSSVVSSSRSGSTATAGATKKPAAKSKAKTKPTPKTKSDSSAKITPRPTGIFKATPVSPALAQFLGTSEATRTDAIKEIWNYVKSHDLQNPADRREIFCDEKLKQIFEGKDKVGFLEITKLLSPHFVNTA